MLFELLSGLRLVHACTFFDVGGGGGGAAAGVGESSTAVFDVDESYEGGAPPGQFNPETGQFETNVGPVSTPSPEGTSLPGPGQTTGLTGGGIAGVGKELPGKSEKKEEKPVDEGKGGKKETPLRKRAARQRKSLLGQDETWTMYGPGQKRTLLGGER